MRHVSLPGMCPVDAAVAQMAESGIEERGAIFTRREVVDFILDLTGYTDDKPLHTQRLLEPSFGNGDFLLAAVERLLRAWHTADAPLESLIDSVRAIELHRKTFTATRARLAALLREEGLPDVDCDRLLDAWLVQGDFLLHPLPDGFHYVVGNPPYVRQELIPDALIAEYRRQFTTVFDRADIYIPFIERSLSLLAEGGALGFICADRWMKNRYGGPLRKMVAEGYRLKFYVDMVDTPAFHSEVIAYPAITVITRERPGPTRLAHRPAITPQALTALSRAMLDDTDTLSADIKEIKGVAAGADPWILESFDQLAVVRRLEREFPTLEETGCKVGIGVATGADRVFIAPFDTLDVEPDRKLPLVMTRDILAGTVQWRGYGVINPFKNDGGLVPLDAYPKLRAHLEANGEEIRKRHVSQKNPNGWYRTIDRIYPALASRPKLLIPDIKGEAHIVYEAGHLYPHHNLYFITSDEWELRALQAVLLSGIAKLFVSMYSTKMRGGYLRFQAQYLRRIRVPHWCDVSEDLRAELADAATSGDIASCNQAVFRLYRMDKAERTALGGNGG
ncbi:Eco57I restriction-modification methylase domain-containing protein [Tistrella sp.]|uniref:Eco57I restriction-modification methylase domain-containing protein n=1 Tax=Tistrella sp. TaxID=2024861 RepID=UPI0025D0A032|nr:Eco57I restriction-modification methylase domain-containing protein [Tistrella sp.]